jgi:hypothetical protein
MKRYDIRVVERKSCWIDTDTAHSQATATDSSPYQPSTANPKHTPVSTPSP